MIKFLQKDSHVFGAVIGIFLPILAYAFLYLINLALLALFNTDIFEYETTLRLISIFFNVVPLRYYLVKAKKEQTGRGVLLATFIYVIVYFSMY